MRNGFNPYTRGATKINFITSLGYWYNPGTHTGCGVRAMDILCLCHKVSIQAPMGSATPLRINAIRLIAPRVSACNETDLRDFPSASSAVAHFSWMRGLKLTCVIFSQLPIQSQPVRLRGLKWMGYFSNGGALGLTPCGCVDWNLNELSVVRNSTPTHTAWVRRLKLCSDSCGCRSKTQRLAKHLVSAGGSQVNITDFMSHNMRYL